MSKSHGASVGDTVSADRETTISSSSAARAFTVRREPISDSILAIPPSSESSEQPCLSEPVSLPQGQDNEQVSSSECTYRSTLPTRLFERSTGARVATLGRTSPDTNHSQDSLHKNFSFILKQRDSSTSKMSLPQPPLDKARRQAMGRSVEDSMISKDQHHLCAMIHSPSSGHSAPAVSTASKKVSRDVNHSSSSSAGRLARFNDIFEVARSADLSRLPCQSSAARSEDTTTHSLDPMIASPGRTVMAKSPVSETRYRAEHAAVRSQPPRTPLDPSLGSPSRQGSGKMREHFLIGKEDGSQRTLQSPFTQLYLQKRLRVTEARSVRLQDQGACTATEEDCGIRKATTAQVHEATTATPVQWSASYPENLRDHPQGPGLHLISAHSLRSTISRLNTELDMGKKLSSKSAMDVMEADGEMSLLPQSEATPDSPISPYAVTDDESPAQQNDTPLTSPCVSPFKLDALAQDLAAVNLSFAVDGTIDDPDSRIDHEFNRISTPDAAKNPERQPEDVPDVDLDRNRGNIDLIDIDPEAQPPVDLQIAPEEATPLTKASKAKVSGFPFPSQDSGSRSSKKLGSQRHPHQFLQFNEQYATPRQRHLRVGSLDTPDRFIPPRSATPTKEAMLLRKPAKKGPDPRTRSPASLYGVADPFGPSVSRSARTADRFATIRTSPTGRRAFNTSGTVVPNAHTITRRAISSSAVWTVGGVVVTEGVASTTNGRGGRVTSGTSAPHYTADFLRRQTPSDDEIQHGQRLAIAMELEPNLRMIPLSTPSMPNNHGRDSNSRVIWKNNAWERPFPSILSRPPKQKTKDIPVIPFRVLNAPALRDDYYCSLLAYSPTAQCLAVGLGPNVYLWSETRGTTPTHVPESLTAPFGAHVTSVSFSSQEGGKSILALGRADGRITLWSPQDRDPRFNSEQPAPISCVSFRPVTTSRPSVREPSLTVRTEELLVGDEMGNVYCYSIEWPTPDERNLFGWHGSMTLLARISCHTQQVCGIAWSKNGDLFATGGNDNQLLLFESKRLLARGHGADAAQTSTVTVRNSNYTAGAGVAGQGGVIAITPGQQKHLFTLNAAVKAIAFAPWQPSLLAAGGGSNDRCIHFFHAFSGATLATIDCHAQVTSLVWSQKKKELAATFGFAQPDHPYRVAVFSWPSCQRVVGIPWWGEERALSAIAYPGGPSGGPSGKERKSKFEGEGRPWHGRRTRDEGCLVIATSDSSIKFHEIWPEKCEKARDGGDLGGSLGGSLILEDEISPELVRQTTVR